MTKPKVIIAGGSGFVGTYLTSYLNDIGYEIVILTRDSAAKGCFRYWDGKSAGDWIEDLEGASGLINLSGRNVNCRLTKSNKREILESRVNSVKILTEAVEQCSTPPKSFIQCSAVGYYGNTRLECTEHTEKGEGFLADVCSQLEEIVTVASFEKTKKCIVRLGVVLGQGGGAYPILARLTNCLMGGALGDGMQYVSWVHIDDVCSIMKLILSDASVEGVFNVTAPGSLTNVEFMGAFRKMFRRPWSPPVPALILKIAAYVLGTNSSILLEGQKVLPSRLLDNDFTFDYPEIDSAIKELAGHEKA